MSSGGHVCKPVENPEELFVVQAGRTDMDVILAKVRMGSGSKAWSFSMIGALAGVSLVTFGGAAMASRARGRDATLTQALLSASESADVTCQKNDATDLIQ